MKDSFQAVNELSIEIHSANVQAGWWTNLEYKNQVGSLLGLGLEPSLAQKVLSVLGVTEEANRNKGELLMLTVSEIAEAMEGDRKNLMDDKLPHRKMFEVELADTMIRIHDIAGKYKLDLGGAMREKIAYNRERADHKIENRMSENGKKY